MPKKPSNKAAFEFWDKMMGAFFTCMGTDARIRCNLKGNRLAHQSTTQCCCSAKACFASKFRNEPDIPVFQPEQWKKLRDKLRGMCHKGNRASGKRMTKGKASSTREDREAMATGCIWLGTAETAEFWHLLNASCHCSGRGSEVSLAAAEGLTSVEVNEDVYQCWILQADIQRQKDGPFQSLAIYPHHDGVLEDFYFSLICLVAMVGCGTKYIFPTFSKAALKAKSGKSGSDVSRVWTNCLDELRNTFETLSDRINEKLASHCSKKGSNQDMANSSSVLGLAQIFRTGWELRGCGTLFACMCGSFAMPRQAGKAASKWAAKIGDSIAGSQPPTFGDMKEDVEGLKRFTSVLFEDDAAERWNPKVRELLVMSLLLRFDQFALVTQSIHVNLQNQQHMISDICRQLSSQSGWTRIIIGYLNDVNRSTRRIETHLMGEATKAAMSLPSKGVIRFSISSRGLANQMSLADVATAFFANDFPAGFALNKESDSWNDLDLTERKHLRNHFGNIKRAARMVSMHADSYPLIPEDPLQHKEVIHRIAAAAEECTCNDFGFGSKAISICKLSSHPSMKMLEKSLKLPENTPEDARKFFKSN